MSRKPKNAYTPAPIAIQHKLIMQLVRGYTIIEMVMVIVIAGIMAVLAIPRFESFNTVKLNGAVKKVISDIRYVQQLAISKHVNAKIVFNPAANSYTVQEFNGTSWVAITDPFTRQNLVQDFNSDPQYGAIDIDVTTLSSDTLRFSWQGVPQEGTDGAPVTLSTERSITFRYRGNAIIIYITPQTGRVRM